MSKYLPTIAFIADLRSSLYTQAWDPSKATNSGQWRGRDHYTISNSVIATNATDSGDVSCPQDVPYLSANGQDFCTAYLGYVPPVATSVATTIPATATLDVTVTSQISSTVIQTDVSIYSYYTTTTATVPLTANPGPQRRDIKTPASVSTWAASRISAACSAIITGTVSTTVTTTAATPIVSLTITIFQTVLTTTTVVSQTSTTSISTAVRSAPYMPTATVNTGGDFEQAGQGNMPDWRKSSPNLSEIYDQPYDGSKAV